MVLGTKYRKLVLTDRGKELVYRTIREIFEEKGLVILKMNGEADHIHLLYEADPFTAPRGTSKCGEDKDEPFRQKRVWGYDLKEILLEAIFLE